MFNFNFNFDFSSLQEELVNSYKQEYENGWITAAQLNGYVEDGIITRDQYTEIVGDKNGKTA